MNILLMYGGKSCEHDISIITACLARGYFDGNIYSAYLTQENKCYLVPNNFTPKQHKSSEFKFEIAFLPGKKQIALVRRNRIKKVVDVDVVVNCCHGQSGEDGAIAGLCELSNLPLVGSGIVGSAVTMDKIVTKQVLRSLGLPTVDGISLNGKFAADDVERVEQLGYPIIVKPSTLGSSIGITLCRDKTQLKEALEVAFWYDSRVLCEKALTDFYELNCAVMATEKGVETSAVDRPFTTNDILTFQDKYVRGEKTTVCADNSVADDVKAQVKRLTEEIYVKLGLHGVVRVDYLVDNVTGDVFVNEINSIPGSLSYGLWQNKYTPQEFGATLIRQAITEFQKEQSLNHKFVSGVLDVGSVAKK